MPPKRKSEAVESGKSGSPAKTHKKPKQAKLAEPYTGEDGWTIHPPSLIYKVGGMAPNSKLACFDLDGTLVNTKSKSQFARDENDWKFFNKKVPQVLKQYEAQGYKLVIFSNQAGIRSKLDGKNAEKTKGRIDNMLKTVQVDMQVFLATEKDGLRKPECGMWSFMLENCNGGMQADKTVSFFVGDAAGRTFDFDDTDKGFAANIGIPFKIPEDVFGEGESKKQVNLAQMEAPADNLNEELTNIFKELADLNADDRFKKSAYQKVATALSLFGSKITMANLKDVKQLPGVGKASLTKIEEFLTTGKVETLERLRGGPDDKLGKKSAEAKDNSMAMKFM
ncbi:unnamed protein product [Ostreobium quekettii]|uniref:Crossover junction endonuclease MUS81-like HHH domain-containing protein n=1 Tax=Ostreobium quekettii TaxID=121088 RepID=A0A8S1J1B3_9CHLO|nr:unnamed protein product [Ostreobium quekettii]|eukprot:evm.model.scf_725.1 EVM.evm.TU.scf_725.1   scf_725:12030-18545(+)